jgi:hypothetical protein
MLSDACFEIRESIQIDRTDNIAALEKFEDAIEHYAQEPFNYPFLILQTLRLVISDTRSKTLSVSQLLEIVEMVREFYDDPKEPSFNDLVKRIEGVVGKEYWLRWKN